MQQCHQGRSSRGRLADIVARREQDGSPRITSIAYPYHRTLIKATFSIPSPRENNVGVVKRRRVLPADHPLESASLFLLPRATPVFFQLARLAHSIRAKNSKTIDSTCRDTRNKYNKRTYDEVKRRQEPAAARARALFVYIADKKIDIWRHGRDCFVWEMTTITMTTSVATKAAKTISRRNRFASLALREFCLERRLAESKNTQRTYTTDNTVTDKNFAADRSVMTGRQSSTKPASESAFLIGYSMYRN